VDIKVLNAIKQAVEAGLCMAEDFKNLAADWLPCWRREFPEVQSHHKFEIGVGIHTGRPMVGLFHTKTEDDTLQVYQLRRADGMAVLFLQLYPPPPKKKGVNRKGGKYAMTLQESKLPNRETYRQLRSALSKLKQ